MNSKIDELIKLNIQVESLLRTLAERESVEALDMLLDASDRLDDGIDEIYNEYKAKGLIVEDDEAETPVEDAEVITTEHTESISEEPITEVIEEAVVEEPETDNEPATTAETLVETIETAEPEITVTPEAESENEIPAEPQAEVETETKPSVEPIAEPKPQPEPQPTPDPQPTPAPAYAPTGFEAPEYIESDQDAIPQANIKVDEMISRQESLDLRRAFTINDKYRFRRELFGGSDEVFVDTINLIMAMSTYDEACEYIYEDLRLDKDNEDVIDFMSIISKHFNALKK